MSYALEKAKLALKAKREVGELKSLDPIQKSRANPKSLRLAINWKCYDCCCGQKTEIKRWVSLLSRLLYNTYTRDRINDGFDSL